MADDKTDIVEHTEAADEIERLRVLLAHPLNRISVSHDDERWRQTDGEQVPMVDG